MKVREIGLAVVAAALLSFASACVPAAGYAGVETYYYYPDDEVYFYPRVNEFFWFDGGTWRHGPRAPARFVLNNRERVKIDMDHPPYTEHARIKEVYKPRREVLKENFKARG